MNIESIGEVKILTQGYQAEYGRSSGLQITAVTKSGTNRFRGSVLRHRAQLRLEREHLGQPEERRPQAVTKRGRTTAIPSAVRSGSPAARTSCSSSTPTSTVRERPINNGNPIRLRVPTALERAGDFSQTLDKNGQLFNLHRDPRSTGPAPRPTAGVLPDNGMLGKIPANRLYRRASRC